MRTQTLLRLLLLLVQDNGYQEGDTLNRKEFEVRQCLQSTLPRQALISVLLHMHACPCTLV
jgi:hypothetical protein